MLLFALACSHPPKLVVDGVYPSDQSTNVPQDIELRISFNRAVPPDRPLDITLKDSRGSIGLSCKPDPADAAIIACTPDERLARDEVFTLRVDIWDDGEIESETTFSTDTARGLAYDLSGNLEARRLGDSEQAAALLQTALDSSKGFIFVLDGFGPNSDDLPWDGNFLAGRGEVRPVEGERSQGMVDPESGFTLVTTGSMEQDGRFRGSADTGSIVIESEGEQLPILVRNLQMRGNLELDFETANNVVISAVLSEEDLEAQIERYPEWAELLAAIADLVDPDVDTDGDTKPDAASVKIASSGPRIDLVDELPGSGH